MDQKPGARQPWPAVARIRVDFKGDDEGSSPFLSATYARLAPDAAPAADNNNSCASSRATADAFVFAQFLSSSFFFPRSLLRAFFFYPGELFFFHVAHSAGKMMQKFCIDTCARNWGRGGGRVRGSHLFECWRNCA